MPLPVCVSITVGAQGDEELGWMEGRAIAFKEARRNMCGERAIVLMSDLLKKSGREDITTRSSVGDGITVEGVWLGVSCCPGDTENH